MAYVTHHHQDLSLQGRYHLSVGPLTKGSHLRMYIDYVHLFILKTEDKFLCDKKSHSNRFIKINSGRQVSRRSHHHKGLKGPEGPEGHEQAQKIRRHTKVEM